MAQTLAYDTHPSMSHTAPPMTRGTYARWHGRTATKLTHALFHRWFQGFCAPQQAAAGTGLPLHLSLRHTATHVTKRSCNPNHTHAQTAIEHHARSNSNKSRTKKDTHVHRLRVACSCRPSDLSDSERTAGSTVIAWPQGLRTVSSWAAMRASCTSRTPHGHRHARRR